MLAADLTGLLTAAHCTLVMHNVPRCLAQVGSMQAICNYLRQDLLIDMLLSNKHSVTDRVGFILQVVWLLQEAVNSAAARS